MCLCAHAKTCVKGFIGHGFGIPVKHFSGHAKTPVSKTTVKGTPAMAAKAYPRDWLIRGRVRILLKTYGAQREPSDSACQGARGCCVQGAPGVNLVCREKRARARCPRAHFPFGTLKALQGSRWLEPFIASWPAGASESRAGEPETDAAAAC